jgi:hypothetical protein
MRAECQEKETRSPERVAKEEPAGDSAAEPGLHHVDHRVLLGDHLGLPHQRDGHEAHRKDAQRKRQAHLCFRSRQTKNTTHPGHGSSQER